MEIYTIDFETYYDREYSLAKITTERYVRDPRFEIIGVSIKRGHDTPKWYSFPRVSDYQKLFDSIDFSNAAILAHNAVFDGAILSWHFGVKPALWLDTLSMARPYHMLTCGVSLSALAKEYSGGMLGAKKGDEVIYALGKRRNDFDQAALDAYGAYCNNDVQITRLLFDILMGKFPKKELKVIDLAIRMYTEPALKLDKPTLTAHLDGVRTKKEKLLSALSPNGDREALTKALMSNEVFASVLRKIGVEPPTKLSPRTGKETYAFAKTDQEFLELQEHENPKVQALVAARLGVKSTLEETRTESFIGLAERGSLPIMLNYFGAHTGRFSGGDKVNLQNLPRGGALRKSITAPDGYVIVAADSSQIEARMVAYLAKQENLVEAFRQKRDVYSEFASDIYGRRITKADTKERFIGKTAILGLGYGLGPVKFRHTLAIGQGGIKVAIDEEEAKRIVRLYRTHNDRIARFWDKCRGVLNGMMAGGSGNIVDHLPLYYEGNKIVLPNGLALNYPELTTTEDGHSYSSRGKATKIYGGKLTENVVQALARIVVSDQMLLISKRYRPALQVHDELVYVIPEQEAAEASEFIRECMSTPPKWALDLPVACEVGIGPNYGEAK